MLLTQHRVLSNALLPLSDQAKPFPSCRIRLAIQYFFAGFGPERSRGPMSTGRRAIMNPRKAGVTQLVEYLLPKQKVAGSSPVSRSSTLSSFRKKSIWSNLSLRFRHRRRWRDQIGNPIETRLQPTIARQSSAGLFSGPDRFFIGSNCRTLDIGDLAFVLVQFHVAILLGNMIRDPSALGAKPLPDGGIPDDYWVFHICGPPATPAPPAFFLPRPISAILVPKKTAGWC